MKPSLLLSSRNAKKSAEIRALLSDYFEVRDLTQNADLPEVEETEDSFVGNATLKAVEISKLVDGYVIADDSGLSVDALGGAPGVWSARYSGEGATDASNNEKLLADLKACAEPQPWKAFFTCCIVLAKDGEKIAEFDGKVFGAILPEGAGKGGFGYDPLFVPEGHDASFGVLPAEVKAKISHRANALALFKSWCEENL